MREVFRNKLFLLLLPIVFVVACATKEKHGHEEGTRYTCPMHPQIITEKPGTCPICKMQLVPVAPRGHGSADDSLAYVVKPTNELVLAGISTVKPFGGKRFAETSVRGIINYNTNKQSSVASRISGRIERLYVRYNYQWVVKGQKLMEFYSPDLSNAQQELLFLQRNGETELLDAAKRKLRLLGMTDEQMRRVLQTGKVDYTVSIFSPYSGYLAETNSSASSSPPSSTEGASTAEASGSAMGSMSSASSALRAPATNANTPLAITEGQYVAAGQKLFSLVNASQVFAEFYARPDQLNEFRRGTHVQVVSVDVPGLQAESRVSLIQPYYNESSRFSLVRAVINNPLGRWKVGQLVTVKKATEGIVGVWLPRTAVLQMGTHYIAFARKPSGFVPVRVEVRSRIGDWVDIGSSLPGTTEVATNAWFLVDSESFIRVDSLRS